MTPYRHRVQYYETDRMGIVHHSNYIRWMEEARVDFLERIGYGYARLEAEGVVSPVRAVSCRYRKSCTFDDEIDISVWVEDFNGVLLTVGYDMRDAKTGDQLCTATSEHVFLTRDGKFIRMKRDMPGFCEALLANKKGEEGSV